MLTVIKRSGQREVYQPEKITQTLAAASDDLKRPLNQSDLKYIARRITELLEGKEEVPSRDIYTCLVGVLYTEGYPQLAAAYVGYDRNPWKPQREMVLS